MQSSSNRIVGTESGSRVNADDAATPRSRTQQKPLGDRTLTGCFIQRAAGRRAGSPNSLALPHRACRDAIARRMQRPLDNGKTNGSHHSPRFWDCRYALVTGRQVNITPLCDACGAGARAQRLYQLLDRGGLRIDTHLPALTWCVLGALWQPSRNPRLRPSRLERIPSTA